ncbi:MAG: polysaccharide biosynthesis tyrosine autokinase [Verrucomicrobiales bacterium]|nr:polysaccharide biosynthesis tyrosine autokinase [Verrucomicrobiales bacterium]
MQDASPTVTSSSRSARSARFFNYLHRYRTLLLKWWWILPLTMLLGIAVQGYRLWTAPPKFAALSRMVVGYKLSVQSGPTPTEELMNFLGTQRELMRSARVTEDAARRVRQLRPDLPAGPVELQISVSPRTAVFNLLATGSHPEYTRLFLDACMESYKLLKKEMRGDVAENVLQGINRQLADLEAELKRYEEEEINFKSSNSLVLIQEQGNTAAKYLAQLDAKLASLKTEHQLLTRLNLEQNLERQQQTRATGAPAGGDADSGSESVRLLHRDYFKAKQELELRKAEYADWARVLKPLHPRMVALSNEITRREDLLEIFRAQSLEELTNRVNSVALEIKTLEEIIQEWTAKALDANRRLALYEDIRTKKQRTQQLYDQLLKYMQTIDVDQSLAQEPVTVLEPARLVPAGPNIAKMLLLGALAGLLAGLSILFVMERLDDRPATFSDLQESFDEPVLGQIPLEHGHGRNRHVPVLQLEDQRHAFVEAYRNLRSSLLYMASEGKRRRVLLVTSAIPSEGKSLTAANFAVILALSGSRVLLVDADLRKGLLHRHFNLHSTPGLNEVLLGEKPWREVVQATPTPNLWLLPRGNTARNPGEMFLKPAMLQLIRELAAEYDFVVFDSAPVMAADDVTTLAPHVEGVVFVIRANFTSARVARAALELLYQRDVSVLGLAFNGVEANSSDYYYYRYKDYYAERKTA